MCITNKLAWSKASDSGKDCHLDLNLVPWYNKVALFSMNNIDGKLGPIRKGLLEFLILKIVAADRVYVADILKRLSTTEFATQEGTLYPLLSKMRRENIVDYEWRESDAGPPRKYYKLTSKGRAQLAELNDYWKHINSTINQLGR